MQPIKNYFRSSVDGATHIDFTNEKHLRFKRDKVHDFWDDFCTAYSSGKDILLIGEKQPVECPVVISVNIYHEPYSHSPYNYTFIQQLVNLTQEVLSNVTGAQGDSCIAAVMETGKYEHHDLDAASIRIIFPLCRMQRADQKRFLREALLSCYKKENVIHQLDVTPVESIEAMVEVSEDIKGFVPIIGTDKPWQHEIIFYNSSGSVVDNLRSLDSLFSVTKHNDVYRDRLNMDDRKPWTHWMPMILSTNYAGGDIYEPLALNKDDDEESEEEEVIDMSESKEKKIARKMLSMMSPYRFTRPEFNIRIGKALYNVFGGDDQGFNLWLSKQPNKEDDHNIEILSSKYRQFSVDNYMTEITLQAYVREDSPREYNRWFEQERNILLDEAIRTKAHGAIARTVHFMQKLDYAYIVTGKRRGGHWYKHTGSYLAELMIDDPDLSLFRKLLRKREQELGTLAMEATGDVRKEADKMRKQALDLLLYTDNGGCLSGVKRFMNIEFSRRTSNVVLDNDPRLTATATTYVLESIDGDMIVRRGILEDYKVNHSYVPYDPTLNWDHELIREEEEFSKRLYRDYATKEYMEMKRSKDLRARNGEKIIELRIGKPHTGKTTDLAVEKIMFGTEMFAGNTTAITSKRTGAENATPSSAHCNNKKRLSFDDPENTRGGNGANEGWLNAESGYSNRHTRFLNDNGGDSEASAAIVISSNDGIILSPTLQMKARVIVVLYLSLHLNEEDAKEMNIIIPDTIEEQNMKRIYPREPMPKETLIRLATARLWKAVQNHKKIDWTKNLPRPASIDRDTKWYWNKYDNYHIFAHKYLRSTIDKSITIKLDTLYRIYVNWYRKAYIQNKTADRNEFLICMKGVIGETDDHDIYHGYKLYDNQFDDFIEEQLETAEDNEYVTLRVAYAAFKVWIDDMGARLPIFSSYDFREYMESSVGPYNPKIRGFYGITLRQHAQND